MSLALILALQAAPVPVAPLTLLPRCGPVEGSDEVVVCGNRRDRYRLPLPVERPPLPRAGGSSADALVPFAPCGIFAGQRPCSKRDAAEFGYGEGRDPISAVRKVVARLTDPDAD